MALFTDTRFPIFCSGIAFLCCTTSEMYIVILFLYCSGCIAECLKCHVKCCDKNLSNFVSIVFLTILYVIYWSDLNDSTLVLSSDKLYDENLFTTFFRNWLFVYSLYLFWHFCQWIRFFSCHIAIAFCLFLFLFLMYTSLFISMMIHPMSWVFFNLPFLFGRRTFVNVGNIWSVLHDGMKVTSSIVFA